MRYINLHFTYLLTCYLLSSQLGSKALNADIGPIVVQPVFEHINRWSIDSGPAGF